MLLSINDTVNELDIQDGLYYIKINYVWKLYMRYNWSLWRCSVRRQGFLVELPRVLHDCKDPFMVAGDFDIYQECF